MPYRAAKKILNTKGVYVHTSPGLKEMVGSLFSGGRYKLLLLKPSVAYLEQLASSGLKVLVSKQYPFADYKRGYAEVQKVGVLGKAVFVFE